MRLFVAIELNDEVTKAAGRLIDELQRRCARLAPRARVTWVPPGRMHLTLRFIGEAGETQAQAIGQTLRAPFDLQPFEFALARTSVFPEAGRPRVFWAGLGAGRESLEELSRHVSARLGYAGVPRDDRPFEAHLTLGRVREAAGLRTRPLLDALGHPELGRVSVTETVLFESRQAPSGPTYLARQRTSLGTQTKP